MKYRAITITALTSIFIIQGCTNTAKDTHYLEKVSVTNNDNTSKGISGFSTDAKQRFVWLPKRFILEPIANQNGKGITKRPVERTILCAEPSPDALSSLAATFSASASGSTAKVNANANSYKDFTESVENIGKRSVGLQLLRDTLYRACEGYANGVIDKFGYSLILSQMDNLMKEILAIQTLEVAGTTGDGPTADDKAAFFEADNKLKAARAERVRVKRKYHEIEDLLRKEKHRLAYNQGILDSKQAELTQLTDDERNVKAELNEEQKKTAKTLKAEISQITKNIEDATGKVNAHRESKEAYENNTLAADHKPTGPYARAEKEYQDALSTYRTQLQNMESKRRTLNSSAIAAISRIATKDRPQNNLASACMMWLANNPNITMKQLTHKSHHNSNTPAIAGLCAETIRKLKI